MVGWTDPTPELAPPRGLQVCGASVRARARARVSVLSVHCDCISVTLATNFCPAQH